MRAKVESTKVLARWGWSIGYVAGSHLHGCEDIPIPVEMNKGGGALSPKNNQLLDEA